MMLLLEKSSRGSGGARWSISLLVRNELISSMMVRKFSFQGRLAHSKSNNTQKTTWFGWKFGLVRSQRGGSFCVCGKSHSTSCAKSYAWNICQSPLLKCQNSTCHLIATRYKLLFICCVIFQMSFIVSAHAFCCSINAPSQPHCKFRRMENYENKFLSCTICIMIILLFTQKKCVRQVFHKFYLK